MDGGKRTRCGNWIEYMILQFPVVKYEDPLDYVHKGMDIAKKKKISMEVVFTYTSGSLVLKLLRIKVCLK